MSFWYMKVYLIRCILVWKNIGFLANNINEKQCCKSFVYLLMHNSHNIYNIIMVDKYFQFCLGFGFMVQENEFENMLS